MEIGNFYRSNLQFLIDSTNQGKAVILHGKGGFFCSGGDLTTVKEIDTHAGGRQMGIIMQNNMERFQNLPLITVAVVEGKAIGGGAELTTACDFRLMTPSAEIGFVHIRLGIAAGWGGGSRLVQLIGPTKALELMASGKRLSSKECVSCGLANDVLEDCIETDTDDVLQKARTWLKPYISGAPEALRAVKMIVNAAKWLPLDQALKKELEYFSSVWGGAAHKTAMTQNVKHKWFNEYYFLLFKPTNISCDVKKVVDQMKIMCIYWCLRTWSYRVVYL